MRDHVRALSGSVGLTRPVAEPQLHRGHAVHGALWCRHFISLYLCMSQRWTVAEDLPHMPRNAATSANMTYQPPAGS